MKHETDIPEGLDFLELVWHQEEKCQSKTDERLPNLGTKASVIMTHLGTVMSLLDRMASCWWVCRGGDHRIEYLCGRAVNNARAAVRLFRFGLYDESLVLCRAIGETANLLQLFTVDRSAFDEWREATERKIRRDFAPYKVRIRLEELSHSAAISQERYALLSSSATHVGPHSVPQSHNILNVPFAYSKLQVEGLLICVNELAAPLAVVAALGSVLLELDSDTRSRILDCARTLVDHIGGANIIGIKEFHQTTRG